MAAGLEIRDLRFRIGGFSIQASLEAPPGVVTAILGASGAGKSTLLALICGFEQPESGEIFVGGRNITELPPARRPITTVFQEHNLFAHLSASMNVGLGLEPGLKLTAEQRADIDDALNRVGLTGLQDRLPRDLSGGERQRVAIARALVMRRPLLVLDEPFAGLGPALRRTMLDLVCRLSEDTGMTVIMVTHDPADAQRIAGFTAFMHQGQIQAFGRTGAVLGRPESPDLRSYLGVEDFIPRHKLE